MKVAAWLMVVLVPLVATPASAQTASLTDDERDVVAAAISATRLSQGEHWLIIVNDTASFRCDGNHTVKAGGCNGGMRTQDQSTEDVIAWLAQMFPEVGLDVLADLRIKNQHAATVSRLLEIDAQQSLMSFAGNAIAGESLQAGSPDALVTVSRVGFNRNKTEAIVYVGGIGMNGSKLSYGEYLRLVRINGRWGIVGRARMWDLGKHS
jgi:hypothetical protein